MNFGCFNININAENPDEVICAFLKLNCSQER